VGAARTQAKCLCLEAHAASEGWALPAGRARAYPPPVGPVEAVLVDAGGVLVLPDRAVVSAALGPGPWHEAPETLDRAHYRAIAAVDEVRPASDRAILPVYLAAYLEALGVPPDRGVLVDSRASSTPAPRPGRPSSPSRSPPCGPSPRRGAAS